MITRKFRTATGLAAGLYALCAVSTVISAHAPPEEEDEYYTDEDPYDPEGLYDNRLDLVVDRLYWGMQDDIEAEVQQDEVEELPSKFDLRDVDGVCYVPEIRDQSPFGTCWSFGAIAASEISIAYALGLDYNTMTEEEKSLVDLSEKHLAWFSYNGLTDDPFLYGSQMGEGYHFAGLDDGIDNDEETHIPYNWGGFAHFASVLFSEGIGPATEIDVPYLNKEGTWEINISTITVDEYWDTEYGDNYIDHVAPDKIDEYIADFRRQHPELKDYDTEYEGPGKYYCYTYYRNEDGDWSLDESQRFQGFFLKESNILPSPAGFGDDGYLYNEAATRAIKEELLAGHGVAINFCSDQSRPGDMIDPEDTYLNFLTEDGMPAEFSSDAAIWAHYTFDQNYYPGDEESINACISSNHAVCIVGYDDNFPKEYFNDPKGTIGGDGAWIVRNSWGSIDNSDPTARSFWGNNGDGYFYISYYDQSLNDPESYEFTLFDPDDMGRCLDIYDLFPSFEYKVATFEEPVYMSNVFTSETKEVIRDLGIMTALPRLNAHVSVYLLNDEFTSPVDGKKVSETDEFFEHKGYHTLKLDEKVMLEKGQSYSVIFELTSEDGKHIYYINSALNKLAHDSYNEEAMQDYIDMYGSLDGYVDESPLYAKMVVNKGESFLGLREGDNEEWRDLTDVIARFDENNTDMNEMPCYDYDNFPIRSYPYSDMIQVEHTVENKKQAYDVGDIISGTVTILNATAKKTYTDVSVFCTLTDLGEDSKIDELKPGESKSINYSYTVTEEDLGGELSSDIVVCFEGYEYVFLEEFAPKSYVLRTTNKKPAAALPSEPLQVEEKAPEPKTDSGISIVAVILAFVAGVFAAAVIVAVIVIVIKRNKNGSP